MTLSLSWTSGSSPSGRKQCRYSLTMLDMRRSPPANGRVSPNTPPAEQAWTSHRPMSAREPRVSRDSCHIWRAAASSSSWHWKSSKKSLSTSLPGALACLIEVLTGVASAHAALQSELPWETSSTPLSSSGWLTQRPFIFLRGLPGSARVACVAGIEARKAELFKRSLMHRSASVRAGPCPCHTTGLVRVLEERELAALHVGWWKGVLRAAGEWSYRYQLGPTAGPKRKPDFPKRDDSVTPDFPSTFPQICLKWSVFVEKGVRDCFTARPPEGLFCKKNHSRPNFSLFILYNCSPQLSSALIMLEMACFR